MPLSSMMRERAGRYGTAFGSYSAIYSCRKATTVQLSRPVLLADGTTATAIPVLKNQNVIIGVAQANRDRGIWGQDAEEWKPDRWLKPLPQSVNDARLPGVYSSM